MSKCPIFGKIKPFPCVRTTFCNEDGVFYIGKEEYMNQVSQLQ